MQDYFAGSRTPVLDVVALALSGGGIRSASFSLGVLQALNEYKCLQRIDYLSTVSGGGYIGSALTATMTKTGGVFVFGESTGAKTAGAPVREVMDNPKVGHLRNYSNYLIPFGARDVVTAIAIIVRGLVANSSIVLGFALVIAAFTIIGSPNRDLLLEPNLLGYKISEWPYLAWLKKTSFGIALVLSLVGLALFFSWAILRSLRAAPADAEKLPFATWWTLIGGVFVALGVGFGIMLPVIAWAPVWAVLGAALVSAFLIGKREPDEQVRYTRPRHPHRDPPPRRHYDFRNAWWHILSGYVALALGCVAINWVSDHALVAASAVAIIGLLGLLWALSVGPYRWLRRRHDDDAEFRTWWPTLYASYLILIFVFFVLALQPFLIHGMFDLADSARRAQGEDYSMLTGFVTWAATIVTPLAAVVTFFREQIGTLFKSVTSSSRFTTKLLAAAVGALVWVAGAALPLLIWVAYLYLSYWGVLNTASPDTAKPAERAAIQGTVKIEGPGIDLRAEVKCGPGEKSDCVLPPPKKASSEAADPPPPPHTVAHMPTWLLTLTKNVAGDPPREAKERDYSLSTFQRGLIALYLAVGIGLILLTHTLRPNANSLHQLYRSRLSKAFLFDPTRTLDYQTSGVDNAQDLPYPPINTMPLSALADHEPWAPYHLINATLNVQGSDYANRRGRNSDFFLFSPSYIGSAGDRICRDARYGAGDQHRPCDRHDDFRRRVLAQRGRLLDRAIAANACPAECAHRLLAQKPALRRTPQASAEPPLERPVLLVVRVDRHAVRRQRGRIPERRRPHRESRRLRTFAAPLPNIIVSDAEADPSLRYPSFITLQRYARIDLGVRIHMPWDGYPQDDTVLDGLHGRSHH